MSGMGIQTGGDMEGAEIIDLAPTILYALGEPIPSDMDGVVLKGAFEPEFLERNAIEYVVASAAGRGSKADYSEEDEEVIRDRLKGMGYVA